MYFFSGFSNVLIKHSDIKRFKEKNSPMFFALNHEALEVDFVLTNFINILIG